MINYVGPMDEQPFVDVENLANSRVTLDPHAMEITDARKCDDDFSLDRQGFKLVAHRTQLRDAEFRDKALVEQIYLREMEALIVRETGADLVISMVPPILRLNAASADETVVRPAALAHSDYSSRTLRTQASAQFPFSEDAFQRYRRVAAYQTWRALSPAPQDNSLAFCDARSVDPSDRVLSLFTTVQPTRAVLEFYMYRYNPAHRWYFFSDLGIGELLLFKGFEGDGSEALNVLHAGFDVPGTPAGTAPRQSIESRALAFFRD